jgi:hypothetical protein
MDEIEKTDALEIELLQKAIENQQLRVAVLQERLENKELALKIKYALKDGDRLNLETMKVERK